MPVRVMARPPLVLALALLLAMPGLAGVPAASAAVQATTMRSLVQTTVETMPTAPLTVSISRIVFTPGASDDAQSFPGLRLLFVEAGQLSLHASGTLAVFHSVAANRAGGTPIATATTTPVPTPTPLRSPTTDVILGPGDGAPVPIWTMHSLRNDGPDPAVVIDVRIAPDAAPGLSPNLDAEVLARAGGLTTLPTGAAAISFGQGTIAPGVVLAASETGAFQLVAAANGGGSLSGNTDGSYTNTGTAGQDVYVVAIVPVASNTPHQPPQPATGPGSDDTAFPAARPTKYGPYTHRFWLWEPTTGTAANAPVAPGPFPVVIYLAGSGGSLSDPQTQNPWMQHLARQGYVVIAPVYDPTRVMDDVKVLVPQALAELAKPGHAAVDLGHVAVLGYSFGGPWAVLYAANAAANGLPVPQTIFVDSPCEGPCATVPPDLTLPPGVKAVVLAFAGDDWGIQAAVRVWQGLSSVPTDDRDFVTIVTDRHGTPPMLAGHDATLDGIDAVDYYGLWKLSDGLFACAFRGQWCEYALGDTPEQRDMGTWSDGVPVTEAQVTDNPATPATPTPAG